MIQYFEKFSNLLAVFTQRNDNGLSAEPYSMLNLGLNTGDNKELVLKNRTLLFEKLNLDESSIAFADQVHGNTVKVVDRSEIIPSCDGLITNKKNLPLAIQVADCACVFFYDPVKKVIALVHSGWRGTLKNIVSSTITKMTEEFSCKRSDIYVQISPCISKENLEIGKDLVHDFPEKYITWLNSEKFCYDMKEHLYDQLKELEIKHIQMDNDCSFNQKEKYFSFRRDKQNSGRMMGLLKML
jgi:polyphenol oxidase